MPKIATILAFGLLLAGCVTNHSLPSGPTPNLIVDTPVTTIRAFVDANGTFYPDRWTMPDVVGESAVRRRHSVLNALSTDPLPHRRAALRAFETSWLDDIERRLAGKRRVFVLVHGFNDPEASATNSYWMIENNLDLRSDDAVVEFFWDGLDAEGTKLGAGRIWFWAAGYSQVAGSRGLRQILNRINHAEIFLISHSRGASVALSSLGNPPYAPKFSAATNRLCFPTDAAPPAPACMPDVLAPPGLRNGQNRIHLLMLAPAIGYPDFWSHAGPGALRDFAGDTDGQFRDIRHTVNGDDPVLKKYLKGLSDNFNATDFGHDGLVSETLAARGYPLHAYAVTDLPHHDFPLYVRCDVVVRMFADAGIGRRQPRAPDGTRC